MNEEIRFWQSPQRYILGVDAQYGPKSQELFKKQLAYYPQYEKDYLKEYIKTNPQFRAGYMKECKLSDCQNLITHKEDICPTCLETEYMKEI